MSRFKSRAMSLGLCGFSLVFCLGHLNVVLAQKGNVKKPCGDYGTQSEMNDCAAREAHEADEDLNTTYKRLLRRLEHDKTATARIVAAEKAWVTFRDAELAADWPVADGENPNLVYGSVHPFCYYNELIALTAARSKALSDRMRHEEGNLCSTTVATQSADHASSLSCSS